MLCCLAKNIPSRNSYRKSMATQIKPDQPLSETKFLQAQSDLYDLGIFDWASIKPLRPIVDQTQELVLVKVHESPLNSMDIGGGLEIIPRDGNVPANSVVVPGIPPISLGNKFTVSQKSYIGPRLRLISRGTIYAAELKAPLSAPCSRGSISACSLRILVLICMGLRGVHC